MEEIQIRKEKTKGKIMNIYKKMFRAMVEDFKSGCNLAWFDICKQCGRKHPVDNCNERYCSEQLEKFYKKQVKNERGKQ